MTASSPSPVTASRTVRVNCRNCLGAGFLILGDIVTRELPCGVCRGVGWQLRALHPSDPLSAGAEPRDTQRLDWLDYLLTVKPRADELDRDHLEFRSPVNHLEVRRDRDTFSVLIRRGFSKYFEPAPTLREAIDRGAKEWPIEPQETPE